MRLVPASVLVLVALASTTARTARADERGARGLLVDLERIVTSEESSGWYLDRSHYDAIAPTVLVSVCHATLEARRVAMERLTAEAERDDPRAVFEREGKMTSAVAHALHVERMRTALERALAESCPFWITPKVGYDGRQTDRNKVTLNVETGALLQGRLAAGDATFGATYSVRLLAGYGFGNVSLLTGAEISGGPRTSDDGSKLVMNYFPTVPLLVRFTDVNWFYTVETGLVSVFQGDDTRLSYGVRFGGGVGVMALRTRYFIPWIGGALFYEHYFPISNRPAAELLRGGLRLGIIYDP
jgi:hypothetical protein